MSDAESLATHTFAIRRQVALLLAPAALSLIFLFMVPFLILVLYSVTRSGGNTDLVLTDFGLFNYLKLVTHGLYIKAILRTLWIALAVVAIDLVLGYAMAYAIAKVGGRYKQLLLGFVVLPLLMSGVIRTFGWMVLLAPNGVIAIALQKIGLLDGALSLLGHPSGVIIGLSHVLLPFMVLSISSNLSYIDGKLEEAAAGLGASPWRTFLRVVLPLTMPGISTGSTFVFILAVGGFVTQSMLGYGRVQVLPLLIFDLATATLNWPLAAAAAVTMLAIILVFLSTLHWIVSMRFPHAADARKGRV